LVKTLKALSWGWIFSQNAASGRGIQLLLKVRIYTSEKFRCCISIYWYASVYWYEWIKPPIFSFIHPRWWYD